MDHAEQKYLAGALFATATATSNAVAPLYKPRKKPQKDISAVRNYTLDDIDLCGGDIKAGLMLAQLRYLMTIAKKRYNGRPCVAKSHGDWFNECRLTYEQARQYRRKLEHQLGLVKTFEDMFAGSMTVHYVLTDKALATPVESNTPL